MKKVICFFLMLFIFFNGYCHEIKIKSTSRVLKLENGKFTEDFAQVKTGEVFELFEINTVNYSYYFKLSPLNKSEVPIIRIKNQTTLTSIFNS